MFLTFKWWRVEISRIELFASLVCAANGVRVKNLRKTPITKQVTVCLIESHLDVSTRIGVYDSSLQGQNFPDLQRDHFFLHAVLRAGCNDCLLLGTSNAFGATRVVNGITSISPNSHHPIAIKAGVSRYLVIFFSHFVWGKIMAATRKDRGNSWASRAPLNA